MEVGKNCPESKHRKKSFRLITLSAMVDRCHYPHIQIFLLYIKNERNFTGSEIAVVKTPHQLYTYEAPVVSRNFKIYTNLQLQEKHRFKESETKAQYFINIHTET